MEHFPNGKQIGIFLDQQNSQKRHRAPKPILLGLKSGKSGNMVPNLEFFEKYIKDAPKTKLCRMDHTLVQTSSRGSELKQQRFGVKFKNTVTN